MKNINKKRCSEEIFREKVSARMKQRYLKENEREKQRIRQQLIWTDQKKKEQSIKLKKYYEYNTYDKRWDKNCKPCILEINGEKIYFQSYKLLKEYLSQKYNFCCSRKIEQKMLHEKEEYHDSKGKHKELKGMKMYYIV